ncbi:MAG TPA: hypothetical protein VJW75_07055 [Candidatus Eisenbacteria bacterium]|nr:hypothetical protein [Candidatus Eisenbacteria bacterium]
MAFANDLKVRIFGDTKDLERSFARANASTAQFGRDVTSTGAKADKAAKSFRNLGTAFAGGFVATEVLQGMKAAIDVASSLQEQISASNVVFEDSAKVIQDWSKTTADSIGVAQDQALTAANTFGSIFDAAGQSSKGAADLSKAVVQLGGDLASFADTSVEDALNALRSGLSGEIEPLRRYRVFLTEAAVAQEAMAASGKKSAQELTQGEKIMARWRLILEQTTKAQGDAARTSDSYANQTRRLSANMRDLQAKIGGPLLTLTNSLVSDLLSGADAASKLADNLRDLGNVVVPIIDIPLRIVGLDGSGKGGKSTGRRAVEKLVTGSIFGVVGLLDDAVRGEGIFAPPKPPDTAAAAKQFENRFDTFIEGLEKGAVQGAQASASKAKSFGQKGFKIVENDLGERLSRRFEDTLDALSLRFDQAVLSKGTADELSVLDEMRNAVQRRIAAHGQTTELLRQLFEIDQKRRSVVEGAARDAKDARDATLAKIREAAEHRREIAEKARQALQARQFRALGLSETGDEIVPGIKNLQTRIEGVLRRVGSGDLDISSKLVGRLKLARNLIRKEGKNLTEDTRRVINELIKTIRDGGDDLANGPLTKTTSLNANRLLEGLGLGRDAEKELRARLSSFNSAGKALAGGGNRPTGSFFVPGSAPTEIHTTVTLDGEVVGRSVRKTNQKNARRNPVQKRGPNRFD